MAEVGGGGGTITGPVKGKEYNGVNEKFVRVAKICGISTRSGSGKFTLVSIRFKNSYFEFADHTHREFTVMHTGLKTANLWCGLLCFATQECTIESPLTASVD